MSQQAETDPDVDVAYSEADVRSAIARDPEAFRRLYVATADRIHRLARWMLGTADVDDAVQDVYVRAWDRLPDLRDPAAFSGWLRQVAVTVVLRRRQGVARRQEREAPMSAAAVAGSGVAPTPVGLRLDLERAVARLPAGARDVFVLYDVEGHRHHEIAGLLDISPHTSRSQLHRARALLKEILMESEAL